jgi:hypothetical protein
MSKIAALALISLLALGCSSAPPAASPEASVPASASLPPRPSDSGDLPATVPPSDAPVTGEVPMAVLDAVRARLAADIGSDASAAVVQVGEEVQWPDGSLGCPEPGVMYTQAIEPGYRVVLVLDGVAYDYRVAARSGTIRPCEGVQPIGS